jgi:hypothetical protein
MHHGPTNGHSLLRALSTACAYSRMGRKPLCQDAPRLPESWTPWIPHLASPCSLIGQIDTHALLSRVIGQPVSATLHLNHFTRFSLLRHTSVPTVTASPTLISKQRSPPRSLVCSLQSESHSKTAANCIHQHDSVTPFTQSVLPPATLLRNYAVTTSFPRLRKTLLPGDTEASQLRAPLHYSEASRSQSSGARFKRRLVKKQFNKSLRTRHERETRSPILSPSLSS